MKWPQLKDEPNGIIRILFRRNAAGRTYMARQFYQIPLQVMKPHYYDVDGTAAVYSLNPAGGILQHDRLLTEIESEAGTDAIFTTPGNNKFYRMDEGCARLWNRLYVHDGGVLEYLPEHNVPFAQSVVEQENEFRVEPGGVLFASDMVTSGRALRGERFDYTRFASRTRIWIGDGLALYDNCDLQPQREPLSRLGLLDGYLSNGSFYVVAPRMDQDLVEALRSLDCGQVRLAAGFVRPDLLVVRFLGDSIIEMRDMAQQVWDLCRRRILGKPALRLRKEFSGVSE